MQPARIADRQTRNTAAVQHGPGASRARLHARDIVFAQLPGRGGCLASHFTPVAASLHPLPILSVPFAHPRLLRSLSRSLAHTRPSSATHARVRPRADCAARSARRYNVQDRPHADPRVRYSLTPASSPTLTPSPRIRSFGPKQGETIIFNTPLTLIVGWNGSGKTVRCFPVPQHPLT